MKKLAILGGVVLLFAGIACAFAGRARAQDAETRKHLLHELGSPFIISRNIVQEDLKLSDAEKQKLQEKLSDIVQETTKVFEKLQNLTAEEREKELQSYRQKSGEKMDSFLKEILKAEQFKRFQQLELQHGGPGSLGRPDVVKALKITQEQRQQFMTVVQDLQRKTEPLMKAAQSGGNPQEIRSKVIKLREEHQEKMETFLSDAQRKQWKEMLGKPLDILND
jgi:hypothetical protein